MSLSQALELATATAAPSYTRTEPWAGAYGRAIRLAREAGLTPPGGCPSKAKAAELVAMIQARIGARAAVPAVIDTTGRTVAEVAAEPLPDVHMGFVTSDQHAAESAAAIKLAKIVERGLRQTGPVIARLLSEQPTDALVHASRARVHVNGGVRLEVADQDFGGPLHPHAFGQLVTRIGMPAQFASKLAGGEEWEKGLLEHSLSTMLEHTDDRWLVRSVNGQVRGVLSNSFRRLDSRPLLEAFVTECQRAGAQPYEGVATDVRSSVRAILPRIYEPVPGEAMVFGLAWSNSDFGAGSFGISAFVLRLVCLNGMTATSELKKIHLGSRLEDLALSQRTYDLDTQTLASATKDLVAGVLDEGAISRRLDLVRQAHGQETDWAHAVRRVATALTKAEQKSLRESFEGPETVLLPPGKTMWRFQNALSWAANNTENPERKLELQSLAGSLLS